MNSKKEFFYNDLPSKAQKHFRKIVLDEYPVLRKYKDPNFNEILCRMDKSYRIKPIIKQALILAR